MAGIGFELRRILKGDNYISLIGAYSYAGLITSGPWILAMMTILALSSIARMKGVNIDVTRQFQVIVVYCIAGSLILSSIFQHSYTRYVADQFYLQKTNQIIPSLNSIYSCTLLLSGVIGYIFIYFLLPDQTSFVKMLVLMSFITLNLIWVSTSVLSGLIAYKTVFFAFFSNFVFVIVASYFLQFYGLRELLISFLSGQFILLMVLIYAIYRFYPSKELINYGFFKLKNIKLPLIFTGLFYNFAIWIDKFMFWYAPSTGGAVIGNLHDSVVYDTPIFLAYLTVIPGAIIFLMQMETVYSLAHENLYKKINGEFTLSSIENAYRKLILAARSAIYNLIKFEGYILFFGFIAGIGAFLSLGISRVYYPLFCVCLIGANLNVVFWAVIDIVFYLDKIREGMFLIILFAVTNTVFTAISLHFGVLYFGYGIAASLLLTVAWGFVILNRQFGTLLYKTFTGTP